MVCWELRGQNKIVEQLDVWHHQIHFPLRKGDSAPEDWADVTVHPVHRYIFSTPRDDDRDNAVFFCCTNHKWSSFPQHSYFTTSHHICQFGVHSKPRVAIKWGIVGTKPSVAAMRFIWNTLLLAETHLTVLYKKVMGVQLQSRRGAPWRNSQSC